VSVDNFHILLFDANSHKIRNLLFANWHVANVTFHCVKCYVGEISCWRNVMSAKCHVGKICWRNVMLANCQLGNCKLAHCHVPTLYTVHNAANTKLSSFCK
jgi:hypothetical protein